MAASSTVRPFRKLLTDISDGLSEDDVVTIRRQLMGDHLKKKDEKRYTDGLSIFCELEDKGVISETNVDLLEDILLDYQPLLKKVQAFKKAQQGGVTLGVTATGGKGNVDIADGPGKSGSNPMIGIVTALDWEFTAMTFMFASRPKTYGGKQSPNDPNKYHIGMIGGKQAVMTQLPVGVTGEEAATLTATRLLDAFDSVRILYMVGIAGGVPNIHYDEEKAMTAGGYSRPHVRKGDVIISYPIANDGPAFIQYDYGKITSRDAFTDFKKNIERKAQIKLSPRGLAAARAVKLAYDNDDSKPWVNLIKGTMANKEIVNAKNQVRFRRPVEGGDIQHPEEPLCRTEGEPKVHFGILASANSVMRNGEIRDKLAEAENIIGFEMENGGIATATSLSSKECMFVRGVCDYADEHKDKVWQFYAALAAAAVAKCVIENMNI